MKIITIAVFMVCSIMAGAQIPTSGLIGHYPFSGNANDISGSANHGTNYGATLTSDRFGNPNSAYNFNGSSNYISTITGGPMGQSSRSISFWAKTNSATNMMAIAYGDANGIGGCFDIEFNLSCSGVGIDVSNGADMRGNSGVHDNQWHNIIVVMDSTVSTTIDNISIYIDGVLQPGITCSVLNSSATVSTVPNNPFVIGKDFTSVRYFDGDIDDILIYNRPLTSPEVSQIFNVTTTGIYLEKEDIHSFNIYPNPTSDYIIIENKDISKIEIHSVTGELLFSQNSNGETMKIDCSSFAKGVYMVRISNESLTLNKKLIINK